MKYFYLFLSILIFGCAGQRPPTGGPDDTTPPEIISCFPEKLSTNVTTDEIHIEFSEYIDRRSVEESIFFSPAIKDFEFDWSDTELKIKILEPLLKDVTYVLTIGTDVVDLNNRNRMAKSFTLAFSTGKNIDYGIINGKIFDEKPDGVMIYAFKNPNVNLDTISVLKHFPHFITQSGNDGTFELSNLGVGNYRLFAVKDEYRNLLFDIESDRVGFPQSDFKITKVDSIVNSVSFKIAKIDTAKPRLIELNVIDDSHLKLIFNEDCDSLSLISGKYILSDSLLKNQKSIEKINIGKNYKELFLVLNERLTEGEHNLSLTGQKDLFGNHIHPLAREIKFISTNAKDTTSPEIVETNLTDYAQFENLSKIYFNYDDVVKINNNAFKLFMSDSIEIKYDLQIKNLSRVEITPKEFAIGSDYTLKIFPREISDGSRNSSKDSLKIFKFKIIDEDRFGSLKGIFINVKSMSGNVIVKMENISSKEFNYKTIVNDQNEFIFPRVMEGEYKISFFEDKNINGNWDDGNLNPFNFSEKYSEHSQIIKIRARWPLEGLILKY
ncbi:MAG: Ig-like domain-containing protein [Bacteroidota bacterium]